MPRGELMKKILMVAVPLLAVLLLAVGGCERKITGVPPEDSPVADQCFELCHNGQISAAQGEWKNSVHASGASGDYTNRTGCVQCHNQDGFVDYITTGTVVPPYPNDAKAIGCFTCHQPHEYGDLRVREQALLPVALEDGSVYDNGQSNLCVNCHHSRETGESVIGDPAVGVRYGPHHGPQGDNINGTGGYEGFDGFTKESSIAHAMLTDACIYCHMANVQTHDGYNVGGHSWNMEYGDYNLTLVCRDCHDEIGQRGGEYEDITDSTDYDNDGVFEGFMVEIDGLVDSLTLLLQAQGVVDASGSPIEQDVADEQLRGAIFNWAIVEEDRSHGVHNPKYFLSLLNASIEYVASLPPPIP